MDYDAIDYYMIRKYDADDSSRGYPNVDDSDKNDCYYAFRDWYESYDHRKGTHLIIDQDFGGGSADGGDSVEKSAFDIARCASVGYNLPWDGDVTVIHEALHTAIIKDEVVGPYYSGHLAPNSEHELGKVYDDGSNEASPLVNNYTSDESGVGSCSTDLEVKSERKECVYCEKEGVYRTTREVFN